MSQTPEDEAARNARLMRDFVAEIPHAHELGIKAEEIASGRAVMIMPWDEKLVGDPATGVIHGGAVSTLMDSCAGAAVVSHPQAQLPTATLDLRIDYMRPATPGQTIRARAECRHVTRTIAFVRAVAMDDDESRPVATAQGAFTIFQGE